MKSEQELLEERKKYFDSYISKEITLKEYLDKVSIIDVHIKNIIKNRVQVE